MIPTRSITTSSPSDSFKANAGQSSLAPYSAFSSFSSTSTTATTATPSSPYAQKEQEQSHFYRSHRQERDEQDQEEEDEQEGDYNQEDATQMLGPRSSVHVHRPPLAIKSKPRSHHHHSKIFACVGGLRRLLPWQRWSHHQKIRKAAHIYHEEIHKMQMLAY